MRFPWGENGFCVRVLKLASPVRRHTVTPYGIHGEITVPQLTREWMNLHHRGCRSREWVGLRVVTKKAGQRGRQGPESRTSPMTAEQREPHVPKAVGQQGAHGTEVAEE